MLGAWEAAEEEGAEALIQKGPLGTIPRSGRRPALYASGMTETDHSVPVMSTDIGEAVAMPTIIDAAELESARLDERWREFCLNAERYVAETTPFRRSPGVRCGRGPRG